MKMIALHYRKLNLSHVFASEGSWEPGRVQAVLAADFQRKCLSKDAGEKVNSDS